MVFVLALLIGAASYSQELRIRGGLKAGNNKQVEASEVPDAVKSSFKSSAQMFVGESKRRRELIFE